jgi:heterodisulfide reductase subunit A
VKYVRAMPSRIVEMPGTRNPRIRYFAPGDGEKQEEFDLVVLSVGMRVPAGVRNMAERLGLGLNEFGFARTDRLAPLTASGPGSTSRARSRSRRTSPSRWPRPRRPPPAP